MSARHLKRTVICKPRIFGVIPKHFISYSPASDSFKTRLTNAEIQTKRVSMFDKEVQWQNSLVTDIEKIKVDYSGPSEECSLIMNKHLSTPYNCAQHIGERVLKESVVAEVNGDVWDMFRPLDSDCSLRFLHFREADPFYVNQAFWRSLSLMLGAILEQSFKNDINVQLCSFPPPKVRMGSFVYDVDIPIESWSPTPSDFRMLSGEMIKLALLNKPFQRLTVDAKLALKMFADNQYKSSQIPSIASKSESGSDVVLYRVGDFIDISKGPTISHTGHVGKCSITAAHGFNVENMNLYRVQGVALPTGFRMNHYAYGIIEERSKRPNASSMPFIEEFNTEQSSERVAEVSAKE